MAEPAPTRKVPTSSNGSVLVVAKPTVTEQDVVESRQLVIQRLDSAYNDLVSRMAPFQREWDASPRMALLESTLAGATAGASEWGSDFADLFKEETWTELGTKVKGMAGSALDAAWSYSRGVYGDIAKSSQEMSRQAGKVLDNPDQTVLNWGWWQRNFEKAADEAEAAITARIEAQVNAAKSAADTATASVQKLRKMYKHRDAIFNLPQLLVAGDPKPVQAFVDTVLADIDPELAKEIRNNPKFHLVLELIADHDSILSYLSYLGLIVEAIPPNFLAYLAAKGSVYLLIEVVLLLVTALLSAGTVAAARVASILARLAANSAKFAKAAKKVERAKEAFEAFIRVVDDFWQAVNDLHNLAEKLLSARTRGLVLRGNTRSTITARKGAIKRDRKCRLCGSSQHTTPRHRQGTVEYR